LDSLSSSIETPLTSIGCDSSATCIKVLNKATESKASKIAKRTERIFLTFFSPIKAY
jgi:hypothetical protein